MSILIEKVENKKTKDQILNEYISLYQRILTKKNNLINNDIVVKYNLGCDLFEDYDNCMNEQIKFSNEAIKSTYYYDLALKIIKERLIEITYHISLPISTLTKDSFFQNQKEFLKGKSYGLGFVVKSEEFSCVWGCAIVTKLYFITLSGGTRNDPSSILNFNG